MVYFWEVVESIKDGVGFGYFDTLHLSWIIGFILFACLSCYIYHKSDANKRDKIRKLFALLVLFDEFFKQFGLIAFNHWTVNDLPLHLCSINIIVITIHVLKPNKIIDNFLYAVCVPAAVAAILSPTWTALPLHNFLHIHSFTLHILLATYPIMLVSGGDIVPDIKIVFKALVFTCIIAMPVYAINVIFRTNYMFLMYAGEGNPLLWFQEKFGFHLLGVPIIESVVIVVLYAPFYIFKAIKSNNQISFE